MPRDQAPNPLPPPIGNRYRDYEREGRVESPGRREPTRPLWGGGFYGEGDPRNRPIAPYSSERSGRTEEQERVGSDGMVPGDHGAIGGRLVGKGPRGYVRSDERIHEDVCETLLHDDVVDAGDVDVRVEHGEVTLAGTVDTRHAKIWAERLAARVRGVRDVRNLLRVRTLDEWDWEPLRVAGEPVPNRIK